MTSLLLAPHYDDESLFCAYTILRHKPYVVICFGDARIQESRGGPPSENRRVETSHALEVLGVTDWESWNIRDDACDYGQLLDGMLEIKHRQQWDTVYAPAVEDGGHEQHNLVGEAASIAFGRQVTSYLTYRRGYSRSWSRNEVTPEPDWPAFKYRAMACYASQINLADTQPWFAADDCLREFYA